MDYKNLAKAPAFYEQLRLWQSIDRFVLVGSFGFFAYLVRIAWQRRRAEGTA